MGHIDLYRHFAPQYIDEDGQTGYDPPNTREVKDWKTSKDVAKWAKSGQDLKKTIQMPYYGKFALDDIRPGQPQPDFVRLSHVYMQTQGVPASKKSTILMSRDEIEHEWLRIRSKVRMIKDIVKETDPNAVPGNTRSCVAFGKPCIHRGTPNCVMTSSQTIDQLYGITQADEIRGNKTMSLLDDQIAQLQQEQAAAQAPAAAPAPATFPQFGRLWETLLTADFGHPPLKADAAQAYAEYTGTPLQAVVPGQQGKLSTFAPLDLEGLTKLTNSLVNSGDAKRETEVVSAPAPTPEPTPAPEVTLQLEIPVTDVSEPVVTPTQTDEEPEVVSRVRELSENPKWTGQKCSKGELADACRHLMTNEGGTDTHELKRTIVQLKSKLAETSKDATDIQTVENDLEERLARADDRIKELESRPSVDNPSGFVLYIDAVPSCPYDRLDTYVNELHEEVANQAGARDMRCSSHDSLSFGKWKGTLAALVRVKPPAPGVYFIQTTDEISEIVAATLCEAATIHVRGVK